MKKEEVEISKDMKLKWDWFEKAKFLCIGQGLLTGFSIGLVIALLKTDLPKIPLIVMIIISELISFILSKMVHILRDRNNK